MSVVLLDYWICELCAVNNTAASCCFAVSCCCCCHRWESLTIGLLHHTHGLTLIVLFLPWWSSYSIYFRIKMLDSIFFKNTQFFWLFILRPNIVFHFIRYIFDFFFTSMPHYFTLIHDATRWASCKIHFVSA